MRRFILGWQQWHASRQLGAKIVNYADDLVILCKPGAAEQALLVMRTLMGRLKLSVNEEQTRTCDAAREHFDFLGYTFGAYYSKLTGGAYYGLRPSKKSVRKLVVKLRELTDPRLVWLDATTAVGAINRTLRGWADYFSLGTVSDSYRAIESYTTSRLRQRLLKKHKSRRNGMLTYSYEYLFKTLGLERLSGRRSNLPWAMV